MKLLNMKMLKKVMKAVKLAAVTIVRLCEQYEANFGTVSNEPKLASKFSDIRPEEKIIFFPGSNAADVMDSCFQMLTGHGFLTNVESSQIAARLREWKEDHEYDL